MACLEVSDVPVLPFDTITVVLAKSVVDASAPARKMLEIETTFVVLLNVNADEPPNDSSSLN